MEAIFTDQAAAFMNAVAAHQNQLLSYARSLTKDPDNFHDLYADTLLKCHDRISGYGFNGDGYVAYMITSIKFNHYYSKRNRGGIDVLELLAAQAEDENADARLALAAGVRAFIVAHFTESEVAAFELHTHGVTLKEIVFLSDFSNYLQVHRVVNKIKKEVRAAFPG